jgi:hypothetical protein
MTRRKSQRLGASMQISRYVLAGFLASTAVGSAVAADLTMKAPPPVPFFFVNDTSIGFVWYPRATDPGVSGGSDTVPGGNFGQGNTFSRYQPRIDHFDVWEYGTNLIHIELDQYGKQDPSLGIPGATGSREVFAFGYSTLGLNELTHSKTFATPLTKDVSLFFGGVWGVQDNFLDEHTTQGVAGLQATLNLPGVVTVAFTAYKEFTRNEFNGCGPGNFGVVNGPLPNPFANTCVGGGSFSGDREFELAWKVFTFVQEPLTFLPPSMPVTFVNILNITGPKGSGVSAANCLAAPGCNSSTNETKTEVFEEARLSLDASKVFWGKPGIWDTFVGYRYWYNKFGTDHNAFLFSQIAPGTSIESTVYFGTTYHFK